MILPLFLILASQCPGPQCPPPGPAADMARHGTDAVASTIEIATEPPDATVTIGETPITLTKGKATLTTPPLAPGRTYTYTATATWPDGTTATETATFTPGDPVTITLTKPTQELTDTPPITNFGIDTAQLTAALNNTETFTFNGAAISRQEAIHILEAPNLQDDTAKLRLTIIGTDEERERVLADLHGPLRDIADACLVQSYPPDHWAITRAGFHREGHPTIYIQTPEGNVLHRQDDYNDGAEGLRTAFERLRRDPDYQPTRDPDLRRRPAGPLTRLWNFLTSPLRLIMEWIIAGLIGIILILAISRGWGPYILRAIAALVPSPPQSNRANTTTPVATPTATPNTPTEIPTTRRRKNT